MNFEINYHPNLFREDTKQGGDPYKTNSTPYY